MSENVDQNRMYSVLDQMHKVFQPEDGDTFRHIGMRFNDLESLMNRQQADQIHLAWHQARNVPVPTDAVMAQGE